MGGAKPEQKTVKDLALRVLLVNFAAIHTTSVVSTSLQTPFVSSIDAMSI